MKTLSMQWMWKYNVHCKKKLHTDSTHGNRRPFSACVPCMTVCRPCVKKTYMDRHMDSFLGHVWFFFTVYKWNFTDSPLCDCSDYVQSMHHLIHTGHLRGFVGDLKELCDAKSDRANGWVALSFIYELNIL